MQGTYLSNSNQLQQFYNVYTPLIVNHRPRTFCNVIYYLLHYIYSEITLTCFDASLISFSQADFTNNIIISNKFFDIDVTYSTRLKKILIFFVGTANWFALNCFVLTRLFIFCDKGIHYFKCINFINGLLRSLFSENNTTVIIFLR